MKSVFLIKSPLQLLNAIEAKYCFELNTNDCVLIIMGDRKSQPQILALANKINEWGSVILLNEVSMFRGNPVISEGKVHCIKHDFKSKMLSKSIFNVSRLNRISKYLTNVEYIFIGYYKYVYMRHFMNVTAHKKVVLLDDGTATIKIAEDRKKGVQENNNIIKKMKISGKRLFQGIKDKEKDNLCFFTMYDIVPGRNDTFVKNDFKQLKSQIDLLPVSSEIFFIGAPISETGIMSLDDCLAHLKRVKEYFINSKLVYITHRRDSLEKLGMIENQLNIKVVEFDYPVEYQLGLVGPRPKVVASFISTALDSCRIIFGSKMKILSFRLDFQASPKREVVERLYESYQPHINENFRVISDY
ncbi:MAG TPA: hypothetical protein ENJ08_07245 [Gammaproteobacteria bacterium]|nr:hypothetical protein [Gammaproteobacteria bacterium]